MEENKYTTNSIVSRDQLANKPEDKPVIKKVATAKIKKKTEFRKFVELFLPKDVTDIKSYILQDVVVPAIKNGVFEIVRASLGIDYRPRSSSGWPNVSYHKYCDDRDRDDRRGRDFNRHHVPFDTEDLVFTTRREAEDVLRTMQGMIDTYGHVSVLDLYDLAGVTSEFTDNRYGWKSIRNAYSDETRDGYILILPKAMPLD